MIGSAAGSRFVVNFSVEGTGERDLQRISGLFKGIQQAAVGSQSDKGIAAGLGQAAGHAKDVSGSLHGASSHMSGFGAKAMVGLEAMEKMGEAGVGLVEAGAEILHAWGKGFEVLLHKGGEFESLILRIQGSGKTHGQAIEMMDKALEITTQLPLTEMDAARIVQTFATIHIDATKRMGESYAELAKKQQTMKGLEEILSPEKMAKEGPKAINIVSDMLSAMGHLGTGYQAQAIHEMMVTLETGKIMSKLTFAGLGGDLVKFRQLLASAKDPAERLVAMQKILSSRGALGLSMAAMSTWGGVMSNFKGLVDRVAYAIDEPGKKGGFLSNITLAMKGLYEQITGFFDVATPEGYKFLGMLRATFGMVGGWMTTAVQGLGVALKRVFTFLGDHPLLVKVGAGLSIVAAGVLIAVGAFLSLSAVLGGVILALVAMPEILLAPIAILGAAPYYIAMITAAVVGATLAFKAWESNFGGIKEGFLDIQIVIEGVMEALEDWHGSMSSISQDTADELEKRGMMGWFLKIVNFIRQAEMAYNGFVDGFGRQWESAGPKFTRAWTAIDAAVGRVAQAIKAVLVAFGMMTTTGYSAVEGAAVTGMDWGNRIGEVADAIAGMAEATSYWISNVVGSAESFIPTFVRWYQLILEIKDVVLLTFNFMMGSIHLAIAGFALLAASIIPVVDLLWGAANAVLALSKGDFSGAGSALSRAVTSAGQDAVKYMKAFGGQMVSVDENGRSMLEAGGRLASGDAEKQANQLGKDAMTALAAIKTGNMSGPLPPTMALDPADAWQAIYGKGGAGPEGWDAQNADETRGMVGRARNMTGDGLSQRPITVNAIVQLDRETIARGVAKVEHDEHEQAQGHHGVNP